MSVKTELLQKIKDRKAVIGIVGLGYVGIPLALRFAETGTRVLGIDIDANRVDALNNAQSPINHISNERLQAMLDTGFEATADFSRSAEADAIIICVPTPLNKYREPDMSYIIGTMDSLKPHLRKGQVLSLESTTYPGTTRELLSPYIHDHDFVIGEDYFLLYSPEREDPGNKHFDTQTIPKVVGGATPACLEVGVAVYETAIDEVVPVTSTDVAELTKLLENIHRAVNIGLVNEMKIIADKMDIDIFEVINAAATKPFGFTPYYPGPGLGGHCIPIDPFYLTWKAREYGINTRFIELAGDINRRMPEWVAAKMTDALNNVEKSLKGSRILALGIAYKKDVEDMRESPAVWVMEQLRDRGAIVEYYDPNVPVFPKMREHSFDLKSVDFDAETIASFDCVVVLTDHTDVDYEFVLEHAQMVVDTRNVYKKTHKKVIKA